MSTTSVGWKECLIASATAVAIASATWYWKNCKECDCLWCKRRSHSRPQRVIFIRHGQSEGNVNPERYRDTPDNAMPLTELGKYQARQAGKCMKKITGEGKTRFIVSPCLRTIETFEGLMESWKDAPEGTVSWIEEPRIREQDFGNFQDPDQIRECKIQRRKFGGFFYRFPSGESPADVYDRVSSFMDTLQRMFIRHADVDNFVLVTHGVTIRVLLMRYFKYSIGHFERVENFHNAEFVVLENNGKGSFEIKQLVYPKVDHETLDVTPVVSTAVRLRECSGARHSQYAHLYDKNSLFSDL
ncbi:unnamed protein product [Aphanomyces euteiches]|uniref:Phosphoglycerate mutase (2,3-diphosphoglycerate-dependent) n=1 Tax=Aphanomyces euteiches TaxID=100861 RepID=A0A6G0XFS5_9STRA|nr:hypothetical protein Ae201684_005501 [Aphanomyces euteiches]KAH9092800.1 hypothetical protein Ae201684P_008469 [Aphanomyces euteiches]KAH9126332.1 hypothetical protein AeMF1_003247 [Aphanomyces euteiches]KAH9137006.1 hypothetical protein LEN26_005963 [Aphanomyces euteiches]KAH9139848.1 hypothetical protein AeRB84_015871 [Aphanomyces euteiches]